MSVTAELIAIGDELLIGQVVNTNAATLSKALNGIGISIERITTVGDNEGAILQSFERAWREHDLVIVTGGLGPTHDDISKAVVALFFNTELEFHSEIYESVVARFERLGVKKMPESNRSQAMVPKGFEALRNEVGTAPGLFIARDGKAFAILPGVPSEMEWILNDSLLGSIKQEFTSRGIETIKHKTIITAGIGESMLSDKIGNIEDLLAGEATLAFLPRSAGVRLRISAKGEEKRVMAALDRIAGEIKSRASSYIVGEEDVSVAEVLVRMLSERGETLSLAESCTGGMIGAAITDIAGSSKAFLGGVICYSNEVKQNDLGVSGELLAKHGAVSEEVAKALAECALEKFGSTYAVSVTGIAGPDGGSEEKPVGLVYVGLAQQGKPVVARRFQFIESRKSNRERSVAAALEMLRRRMTDQEHLYTK